MAFASALLIGLCACAGPMVSTAAATPGARVSVGLFGDSVTEGIVIPHFQTQGLAAQLSAAETREGFSRGGQGLIAANQYQWHFSRYGILGAQAVPRGGWALIGGQDGSVTQPGLDGPSGYSAETTNLAAQATTTVHDPLIEVLYTTSLLPCSFEVTSGARHWSVSSYELGVEPVAAEYPIDLGPGTHEVTVHGGSCGGMVLGGIVAQRPVPAAGVQMQVDNDGHAARAPGTDLSSRVEEAIVEQHYALTVLLFGYIGELEVSHGASARDYARALLTRARLARLNGGRCLIAQPTPMPVSAAQIAFVAGIERHVAAQAGCTYSTALAHLWRTPSAGITAGLVVIDGIHPTAAGYRLMARTLAPTVARLVGGAG